MTNQQGAPEALRLAESLERRMTSWTEKCFAAFELRRLHAENERLVALVDAQQAATHVQNPAEIEHVAGGVSKNGPESNMAQQPAPSAAVVGNSGFDYKTAADFLNGKTVSDEAMRKFVAASRWVHDDRVGLRATLLSVRSELASREAEIALLKKALMDAEAPQPSPTPQADSQPAAVRDYPPLPEQVAWRDSFEHCDLYWRPVVQEHNDLEPLFTDTQMRAYVDADRAARAPADSVLEDADRYRWLFGARTDAQAVSVSETVFKPLPQDEVLSHLQGFYMSKTVVDALVDAARKQGANHD